MAQYGPGRPTPEATSRQILQRQLERNRALLAQQPAPEASIPDLTGLNIPQGPTHSQLQEDIQAGNVGHQQTGGFQPTPGAWPPQITPGTIPDFSNMIPDFSNMVPQAGPGQQLPDPNQGMPMGPPGPTEAEILQQAEASFPQEGGGRGVMPQGGGIPEQPGFLDLANNVQSALGGAHFQFGGQDFGDAFTDPETAGQTVREMYEQAYGMTPAGMVRNLYDEHQEPIAGFLGGFMGRETGEGEPVDRPVGFAGRSLGNLQEQFGGAGAQDGPREGEFGTILAETATDLPPSADDVLPEGRPPQMDRAVIDDYLEELEGLGPDEFEERSQSLADMLGGISAGMAGMGGDATMGQMLLGAGSGAHQARQQHLEVERQRSERHDEIDRQHRQQMAQAGLEAEATLLESERQAYRDEMERGITEMEINEARRVAMQPNFDFQNGMLMVQSTEEGEDGQAVQRVEINPELMNQMMNAQSGAANRTAGLGGGGGREQVAESVMVGTNELGGLSGLSDEARHVLSFSGSIVGGTNILQAEDPELYNSLEARASQRIAEQMERREEAGLMAMDQDDIDDQIEAQMAMELAHHFSTEEGMGMFANLATRYGDPLVKMLAAPQGE